jgi:short-subunit dehydrogenase
MRDIFVVTGCSSGLGKELSLLLLKKNFLVIGISRNNPGIKKKNFFFIKNNFEKFSNNKNNILFLKKFVLKRNIKLIINAGINFSNKQKFKLVQVKKVLDINFVNQFYFLVNIINKYNSKIKEISFISSYDVFTKEPKQFFAYSLSKIFLFELAKLFYKYSNSFLFNVRVIILGGIKTKMYARSNKDLVFNKKKNKINGMEIGYVSEGIINFLLNSKKRVFFLPKRYKLKSIKFYIRNFKNFIYNYY